MLERLESQKAWLVKKMYFYHTLWITKNTNILFFIIFLNNDITLKWYKYTLKYIYIILIYDTTHNSNNKKYLFLNLINVKTHTTVYFYFYNLVLLLRILLYVKSMASQTTTIYYIVLSFYPDIFLLILFTTTWFF